MNYPTTTTVKDVPKVLDLLVFGRRFLGYAHPKSPLRRRGPTKPSCPGPTKFTTGQSLYFTEERCPCSLDSSPVGVLSSLPVGPSSPGHRYWQRELGGYVS